MDAVPVTGVRREALRRTALGPRPARAARQPRHV